MIETVIHIDANSTRCYTLNTVIVGTGAAGYNAADRLHTFGQKDIAIVTEGVNAGTSRNTGSDKQTYFKLTLSGGDSDSVREMAKTLYEGQCVDGDIALCEAALSVQGFLHLVELGVPFPRNQYGEYIGYKTDHDLRCRATSVGPYTSKQMTECLQASVEQKSIRVFDRMQIIKILVQNGVLQGLVCLDLSASKKEDRFAIFHCRNVIFATGGPAGMYADSVYPFGHCGSTGIAFEAGVNGKNLTEWQFGLASVKPRWNVSGTYMQVLPRFLSTNQNGGDEKEFLYDFFEDEGSLLDMVFLKGYQWPFDVRKVKGGSSIIDILVNMETSKGRRVFLDYRRNPGNKPVDFERISSEPAEYLNKAGACFGTPIERLLHMNHPAVDFYKDKGVDLTKEPLEIALCVQHNNGGLGIDCWWQTNIEGLFAVGEVAASHGVYRPGGSALNAGQVGSYRAAQYIAVRRRGKPSAAEFETCANLALKEAVNFVETVITQKEETVNGLWEAASIRMSRLAGAIRDLKGICEAVEQVAKEREQLEKSLRCHMNHMGKAFRLRDMLICQQVYMEAMINYIEHGGKSRGSALYTDPTGEKTYSILPESYSFTLDNSGMDSPIQEVVFEENRCRFHWRTARPIPEDDDFFENVWRSYRENGNIR